MTTSSTIPLVKRRVLELLGARKGLAEVQQTYSHPNSLLRRESIYFAGATGQHEARVIRTGRQPRTETYNLAVVVVVHMAGKTAEEAEARAFDLMAEVEDALADDPTLGITPQIHWARFGAIREVDTGPWEKGGACAIEFDIDVSARLD